MWQRWPLGLMCWQWESTVVLTEVVSLGDMVEPFGFEVTM
jgi:hypothetical protein